MKNGITITTLLLSLLITGACAQVSSSELESTAAEDMRLEAVIEEVQDEETTSVSAYLETADSEVDVRFTEGEYFQAYSDGEEDVTSPVQLNESTAIIDFDNSYTANVNQTTEEGSYYLSYFDEEGTQTLISVPRHDAASITNLSDGDTVGPNTVTIEWNADEMSSTGTISILVRYSSSGTVGYIRRNNIPNTGTYELDLGSAVGTARIDLRHEEQFTDYEAYSESLVKMRHISRVTVSVARSE